MWYCNNNPMDGCEVDTLLDVANCGVCGNNCVGKIPRAQAKCDTGACAIDTCAFPYANCDNDLVNG